MIEDFLDWLINEFLNGILHSAYTVAKILVFAAIAVLLLPIWIVPFIYWLLVERRKR